MSYAYTPAYYSSFHDSITSLCKSILPFSFKKRRLPASEQKLSKQQSDNLKWQQDSFHRILNLMGLHREGILPETEVSAFRSKLLETLTVSRPDHEQPVILRDKLLFLQELLYAKCISTEEYHASKRPLLQRLAVQGVEIDARDLIIGPAAEEGSDEEWSVIDLRDEQCLLNKENSHSKSKSKHASAAIKHIKGAIPMFGSQSSKKKGGNREDKSIFDLIATKNQDQIDPNMSKDVDGNSDENPFWDHRDGESETKSILMSESLTPMSEKFGRRTDGAVNAAKVKKKAFLGLFQKEEKEGNGDFNRLEEGDSKSAGKRWVLGGFKKWKTTNNMEDEIAFSTKERSEGEDYCMGTSSFVGSMLQDDGPVTKQIKRKLHADGSASDFFIDKVLGENIKEELSRIQTELLSTNSKAQFSEDQIEEISTKLPVDKGDLKKFFPKSWCDQYGDLVLDVVKKEFKEHVGEMENKRAAAREKHTNSTRWTTFDDEENDHPNLFAGMGNMRAAAREKHENSTRWTTFDDDEENCHPNLFVPENHTATINSSNSKCISNNPFLQYQNEYKRSNESALLLDQNPLSIMGHRSSLSG